MCARDIEYYTIVFHHLCHPISNQGNIYWNITWFHMDILEVFVVEKINHRPQFSFDCPFIITSVKWILLDYYIHVMRYLQLNISIHQPWFWNYLHWFKRMCLRQTNHLFAPCRQTLGNKASICRNNCTIYFLGLDVIVQ